MTSPASRSLTATPPFADRIVLVGLLPVQRDRIIDRGRDAFAPSARRRARRAGRRRRGWCIAPRPRSSRPARAARVTTSRKAFGIAARDRVRAPRSRPGRSSASRSAPRPGSCRGARSGRCGHCRSGRCPARASRRLRSSVGELIVVGEHRAAVAVAAERLGRKEAGRGGMAEGAELAALVGRAESLRGVVDDEQAFGLRRRPRSPRGRPAGRTDRPGSPPSASGRAAWRSRRRAAMPVGIDVERRLRRRRQTPASRRPARPTSAVAQKVKDGQNTASPGPMPLRHQRQHQRVGAAGAGRPHGARRRTPRAPPRTRAPPGRDELAVVEHARDRGVDARAEPAALRGHVDERNRRRFGACRFIVRPW